MRKAARPHAIREVSGPETRVSLGVALHYSSGVGTVERLGGPLRSKMLAPEAILHKIKHVTVMRLLIVGGARPLLL